MQNTEKERGEVGKKRNRREGRERKEVDGTWENQSCVIKELMTPNALEQESAVSLAKL